MGTKPDRLATGKGWPSTWEERHTEYKRRRTAYLGGGYTDSEFERLGLFQGTDADGKVIHVTRRIGRDLAFVADVDALAIVSGIALQTSRDLFPPVGEGGVELPSEASEEALEHGLAVWRRSRVRDFLERWARGLCVHGDLHLEAVVGDDGLHRIASHLPEHVEPYYDDNGIDLTRAEIRFTYQDPPNEEGARERHSYRRILLPDRIVTIIDGVRQVDPNPLGVVPLVHVQFRGLHEPDFGLHAFAGYEEAAAIHDSAMTQLSVIGARHASPLIVGRGVRIADDTEDAGAVGKFYGIPTEADLKYLEATLTGVNVLATQAGQIRDGIVETLPEYLFTESGANASGTALSYRAGEFVAKIEPVRRRFLRALALATSYAVAMDLKRPWNVEHGDPNVATDWYEVTGGPLLPVDRRGEAELIGFLNERGYLKTADAVRGLQGYELVPPDEDPVLYAEEARAEADGRDADVMDRVRKLANMDGAEVVEIPEIPAAEDVADAVTDDGGLPDAA